jgi:hypothetical protein
MFRAMSDIHTSKQFVSGQLDVDGDLHGAVDEPATSSTVGDDGISFIATGSGGASNGDLCIYHYAANAEL